MAACVNRGLGGLREFGRWPAEARGSVPQVCPGPAPVPGPPAPRAGPSRPQPGRREPPAGCTGHAQTAARSRRERASVPPASPRDLPGRPAPPDAAGMGGWDLRGADRGAGCWVRGHPGRHPTPTRPGARRTRGRTSGRAGSPGSPRHVGHPGGRRPGSPGGAGAGRGRGRRRVGRSGLGGASVGVRSSLAESWGPRRSILSPAEGAHRRGDSVFRGPRGSPPPPRGGMANSPADCKDGISWAWHELQSQTNPPRSASDRMASLLTCGDIAALCGERTLPGNPRPRLQPPKLITNLTVAFKKLMGS